MCLLRADLRTNEVKQVGPHQLVLTYRGVNTVYIYTHDVDVVNRSVASSTSLFRTHLAWKVEEVTDVEYDRHVTWNIKMQFSN